MSSANSSEDLQARLREMERLLQEEQHRHQEELAERDRHHQEELAASNRLHLEKLDAMKRRHEEVGGSSQDANTKKTAIHSRVRSVASSTQSDLQKDWTKE